MSDPTIQTFCCHHSGNNLDMAVKIMNEFNTDSYNTVCLTSAAIGIIGAIYQIIPSPVDPEKIQKWHTFSSIRGRRIIIWLAVADLFASLGVLIRSSLWLRYKNIMPMPNDDVSVLFCSIISAWTQYFYTATWFWTLFYAIDTWLTLKGRDSHPVLYHSVSWGVPAATTSIGLSILYLPDATCHNLTSLTAALIKVLPNYFATYLTIAIVMIVNPIMYMKAGKDAEVAVALPLAQFTSKERKLVDALRCKFFLINMVFYVCWLPNLVNGILLWTMWFNMPVKVIISIWYIMALMNPLQALLNALVYRSWKGNQKCCSFNFFNKSRKSSLPQEYSPLLGSVPVPSRLQLKPIKSSINTYATL